MEFNRIGHLLYLPVVALVLAHSLALPSVAQVVPVPPVPQESEMARQPVMTKIRLANTKVEMTVNASRILTMDQAIPQVQVSNPDLLDLTALSENQVQIHAKKAGITTVNMWDDKNEIHTVDVVITPDMRELEHLLRLQFPTCSIKLFPTSTSLIMSGYVDRPDYVNRIVTIAQDYYPKIINLMMVGGAQQVLLHVKVMEVSRTKLRTLGFDFAAFNNENFIVSGVSGLVTKGSATAPVFRNASIMTTSGRETFSFGILDGDNGFVGFLEALKQENLLKVLAEPDLVAISGRPATYLVGGEVPYPKPTGFGNISIEFRQFGTQIDFVPIVLGNGGVRLEVRPQVSEIDPTLSVTVAGTSVPGFRQRYVETGVELKFGQTLAIAGLLQQRTQAERKGIPVLMDVPYLGAAFRRTTNTMNEVELVIMVRPELIEALDPDQVPPCGPGMNTMSPADCDLYWKGHIEVPIRHPNGFMGPGLPPVNMQQGPTPAEAPANIEDVPVTPTPPIPGPVPAPAPLGPSSRRLAPAFSQASTQPEGLLASRRLPEAPAQMAGNPPADSPNPSNPQAPKTRTQTNPNSGPPGFIGPRGYDVRK